MPGKISHLAVVDQGAVIGDGTQVWHFTHIREGVKVGNDTTIGSHCYIDAGVNIGAKCKIQSGCLIYRPASIGDGVFIGPGVSIINDKNPRAVDALGNKLTDADWVCEGVTIDDGASIGTGAILMPGIRIGKNARVGAGSIVTKDVEPEHLVYGIAAKPKEKLNVVAIMIVRNEEATLPRCLEHLAEQGLKAAVIDNGSTDRTREILESFSPGVVIRVDHAPFDGIFRWKDLLTRAHAMQQDVDADWFHLNSPDEIFNSDRPGERLADAIRRVDAEGYTAINYDEFVFVPTDEETSGEGKAFDKVFRRYYFYQPQPMNQMRTWKKAEGISNIGGGGHRLIGPGLNVYPVNLPLRHYIALSADHFRKKYKTRKFPKEELAIGWHFDRAKIDADRFRLPRKSRLKYLVTDDLSTLDRSEKWKWHFWEAEARWPRARAFAKRLLVRSPGLMRLLRREGIAGQ